MDDFLMNAVASDPEVGEEFCRTLISSLLQREVGRVKVICQKVIPAPSPDRRGIRMDCVRIVKTQPEVRTAYMRMDEWMDAVERDIRRHVEAEVREQVEQEVREQVEQEVREQVVEEVREQLAEEVLEQLISKSRETAIEVLMLRGLLSEEVSSAVQEVKDIDTIDRLLVFAGSAQSPEEVLASLEQWRANSGT